MCGNRSDRRVYPGAQETTEADIFERIVPLVADHIMELNVRFVRSPALHPGSVDRVRINTLLVAVVPSRITVTGNLGNIELADATNREG